MIDFRDALTLHAAAQLVPARRDGRPTHPETLKKWATKGSRGVVLETIQVGASLCTSIQAMQAFFEALTKRKQPPRIPGRRDRERQAKETEKILRRAGIAS